MNTSLHVNFSILIVFTFLFLFPSSVNLYAHSGRTDSSGGHNCYTGSCAGTYHYHNAGNSYTPTFYTPPQKTCGRNAYLAADNECYCYNGYTPGVSKIDCVALPQNAHPVESTSDAWECDHGYKEVDNDCIIIEQKKKIYKEPTVAKTEIYNMKDEPIDSNQIIAPNDNEDRVGLLAMSIGLMI